MITGHKETRKLKEHAVPQFCANTVECSKVNDIQAFPEQRQLKDVPDCVSSKPENDFWQRHKWMSC